MAPTLIRLLRSLVKRVDNLMNISNLMKRCVNKGIGDSLNKTLFTLMNRTLLRYL